VILVLTSITTSQAASASPLRDCSLRQHQIWEAAWDLGAKKQQGLLLFEEAESMKLVKKQMPSCTH